MYSEQTHYDVLDLKPDASQTEVREAYLRAKSAYTKDSVALYTLIGPEEREEALRRIEDAYSVLSHAERRREYDRNFGSIEVGGVASPFASASAGADVVSIDRVPPMESPFGLADEPEAMLIAPAMDVTFQMPIQAPAPATAPAVPTVVISGPEPLAMLVPEAPRTAAAVPPERPLPPVSSSPEDALAREIAAEQEWRGEFLRRVREVRRLSIEEMANLTKVSKTYLLAIEEENYTKLPAAVFLRGFLVQVARTLRVPSDKVPIAFLSRYYLARPDQKL